MCAQVDPHSLPLQKLGRKRILVAGATGFIGSHFVRRVAQSGAEVHAVGRRIPSPNPDTPGPDRIRWHVGDLSDSGFMEGLADRIRPDVVFQLAGHVDGSRSPDLVRPTLRGNLLTTINLLILAERVGTERVVIAGSMDEPWGDAAGHPPPSPYAAAKWAASGYGLMFDQLYSLEVVVARLFMVYGPGQSDHRKLIPYTVTSLLRGEAPTLTSGTRRVDWIFVTDVVDGLLRAGTSPGVSGRVIDMGSGTRTSVRDVVKRIVALVGSSIRPEFGRRDERPQETERVADLALARRLLGWEPRVDLNEGLNRTVRWYRDL